MLIQKNIPVKSFTTYQAGGSADLFVFARTRLELKEALLYARERGIPYFVLGLGANILFSDKGFRGLVIRNLNNDCRVESYNSTERDKIHFLRAGSGAVIERIIHFTRQHDLSGFEHFAGIPSTVGGALWQNLHFLNPERTGTFYIEKLIHHATVLNMKTGQENFFFREDFKFGYDTSVLHQGNHVVLDATFQLQKSDFYTIGNQMRANLAWRKERHPALDENFSCGSVFKKVNDIAAAKLIDQSGLKGFGYNGVVVSLKHPNFITHTGGAAAADIKYVIDHVKQVVFEKTGVLLETEIRFVGDWN